MGDEDEQVMVRVPREDVLTLLGWYGRQPAGSGDQRTDEAYRRLMVSDLSAEERD